MCIFRAFQVALVVKNRPAAGDIRDVGSIPGSGRSPGRGHGNTLQYSSLEDPMDRGAWWAIVPGVAKGQTQLSNEHYYCYPYDLMAFVYCLNFWNALLIFPIQFIIM